MIYNQIVRFDEWISQKYRDWRGDAIGRAELRDKQLLLRSLISEVKVIHKGRSITGEIKLKGLPGIDAETTLSI